MQVNTLWAPYGTTKCKDTGPKVEMRLLWKLHIYKRRKDIPNPWIQLSYPDTHCMAYLPTFAMLVFMVCLGKSYIIQMLAKLSE